MASYIAYQTTYWSVSRPVNRPASTAAPLPCDGRVVQGILFPRQLAEGIHRDITAYGGWREYIAARDPTMQRPATQPQLGCPRPLVETAGPAASGECR